MTIMQQIQWVCLPGGFHPGGALRLSVFVAPRLVCDQGDTLAVFPDFLDWPARLATATFQVRTDDPRNTAGPATLASPPADSPLWRAFFGPATPVHSHVPDNYASHQVTTYPARRMSSSTRSGYTATAAASPSELPRTQTLPYDQDSTDRFTAFHRRPPTSVEMGSPESFRQNIDFHQMLSALGDHPSLLRRLGLVFELSLPADRVLQNDLDQAITLVPSWQRLLPADQSTDIQPFTWYVRRPDLFVAAGRGSSALGSLSRGLITLPEHQFSIEQTDIDGVVQKALAMDPADDSGFPALRTSGFSLVRDDRATFLQQDFATAARREEDLAQGRTIDLFADDLVRGHRLDVRDETAGRWFSLHERVVSYTVTGADGHSASGVRAEGFFQVSLTQPAGTDAAQLYIHERFVTWDGWSLSSPRPGKVLSEDPRTPDPGDPATLPKRIPNTAMTALPLEIEAAVLPGSLPRLRFGRGYRFRVRTVDLAGNGPTLADAPDLGLGYQLPAGGPAVFLRFEPVPPPALLARAAFTEGASTDRLVIRSTPGQSATEYAGAFNQSALVRQGGHPPYPAADERHLVAPKAALQLVEWHGMLDEAIGAADPAVRRRVYELARREKGRLDDPSLPGVTVTTTQPSVLHTTDSVTVPYLPDPLATGVVLHGLPGGQDVQLGWDGPQWHQPRSLRLRLTDGPGPPHWDQTARVLTVGLPPGTVATVRVSSQVKPDPGLLGVLAWCRDELSPEQFAQVMQAATANRLWMITPWQDVTLVHAVQRPLTAPDLQFSMDSNRQPGDTSVHLVGNVQLSAASTERIDMIAEWRENIDDLAFDRPAERDCSAHVFRLPIALAQNYLGDSAPQDVPCKLVGSTLTFSTLAGQQLTPPVPAKHEFGDTKHRSITYHAVAGSAFREYFPPQLADTDHLSVVGRPVPLEVLSSAPPAAPRVMYCIPTQSMLTSEAPDTITRRRHGGSIRVYLQRPWFSSGDGELLGVLVAGETPLPHEQAYSYVSLVGRDPIYDSESLHALSNTSFPAHVVLADGLSLPPALDHLNVTVAGHQPSYDTQTGRWFCDIDLDTEGAYFPFVRLALARYQPKSLPGMHLSEIVLTDIVRTLPDRTLTVSKKAPISVAVSGPSYLAPEGSRMVAQLDRRDPTILDEVLGWRLIAGTITNLRAQSTESAQQASFVGEVPSPARPAGERRRVTVMEYERLPSDVLDGTTNERLVYCDTVEI